MLPFLPGPSLFHKCQPLFFLNEESSLPCAPLFPKWIYCYAVSSPPPPSPLRPLREMEGVIVYFSQLFPVRPSLFGVGLGDGGVSKLYIELLTGAEALWFPWQLGWK